ncbi:hypothetical protein CK203_024870 [Vitis vinifera]|uniref:Uncharacterized protein n=1 Tax=Vitis vinifera TaxID=29760 RepID=A0A438ITG7_VITVI|nr:hypothetical protein CK203_024870 [Vitis vinifera]
MDCIMFINGCINSETTKRVKVPYFAARMISKQMEATWLFPLLGQSYQAHNLTKYKNRTMRMRVAMTSSNWMT